MPYNRGGGRGGEPQRDRSSYRSPPAPRDTTPRVPVRATGRGVGPDGTPFELSFEIDIPVSCLKTGMPEDSGFRSPPERCAVRTGFKACYYP